MGLMGCPEKSIRNCHYPLRNNPGKSSSHLLSRGSLKSSIVHLYGVATLHYIQRDSKDVLTRKPSNFPCYTRSKCGSEPSIIKGTSLEDKNVVLYLTFSFEGFSRQFTLRILHARTVYYVIFGAIVL